MNSLKDYAMTATLTVRQWTARKLDPKATREVNANHGAKNAGRFNKLLIAEEALRPTQQIEGAARQYHYSMTTPWGDKGERVLPATLFDEYTTVMEQYKREFDARVRTLHEAYPRLVQEARVNCGTLYDPKDYPSDVRDRYFFKVTFDAISTADDFRVTLSEAHLKQIREDIESEQLGKLKAAQADLWDRVREIVENIRDTCSKDKPRIYDSMMEKTAHLIKVLPALNLNGDPELARVAQDMQGLLVPTSTIKANAAVRSRLADDADKLLARMQW